MSCKTVISDIAEIIMGQSPKKNDVNEIGDGLPLLNGPTEFTDRYPEPVQFSTDGKRFSKKGDILFCVRGSTTGRMNYSDQPYAIGRGIAAIRGKGGFPTPFVKAVIENNLDRLLAAATGSTFPNVSKSLLNEFEVDVISSEEAQKVNDVLVSLEEKTHLNQQTNETLEAMAQAIFKSWFVDYDPVRAKIEATSAGRDPNRAAMAAISGISLEQGWDEVESALDQKLSNMTEEQRQQLTRTAELFPDELVESEIGEVPKGWEVANYGKLIEYMIGGDWGKEEPTKKHTERVRIFRGTDLPDVFQGDDESVPTRFVQSKKLKTRKLQHGDIVFEVSGGSKNQSTGRNLLITDKLIKRFGSDLEPASFCKLMRPASIELSYYLGVYLRKAYDDDLMWQFQVQSTGISNFQTNTFMDQHYLVVPSNEILKQFQSIVEPIFDKIYNDENSELKKLRDTLLPKLISGEVGV